MDRPFRVHWDEKRRLSLLYFKGREREPVYSDMRGGVCWPMTVQLDKTGEPDVYGYLLMAGKDIVTDHVTVYEQLRWVTVNDILDADTGEIRWPGVGMWLNGVWKRYNGLKYFFFQDFPTASKYRLEITRSHAIQPKPQFIEAYWQDTGAALAVLWQRIQMGKLTIEKGSQLLSDLRTIRSSDTQTLPSVHALLCCLAGMERFPYRGLGVEEW